MVVTRDYMLKQRSGPSAPKLFLDTKLVPAAVNTLGAAEVALNRASVRTGLSGRVILGSVAALGSAGLGWLLLRRRSRAAPSDVQPLAALSPQVEAAEDASFAQESSLDSVAAAERRSS
jgi:hypothetical protein